MIEIKNLNKTYHTDNHHFQALKNINLNIRRGEIFGVLGKSGAGKSTLLRCINLLEKPNNGQVIINDIELTLLSSAALRAHRYKIGVVFQHFNLLESRTAFDNIALPLEIIKKSKQEIHQKVSSLLELVGLIERKDHFPSQLSGGQKQRIAIARALAADPHVLLCDEATSSLDTESTKSVLYLLKKINQTFGLTILLITHELEVIKTICDRVGVIHEGELIEQDLAINVLVNPKKSITKQLVQQAFDFNIANHDKNDCCVIRLTFIGESSDAPFISLLAKEFDITLNIRQALIEKIQGITVGFTICELSGQSTELTRALEYIRSTSIKVEVINHA